MLRESVEAGEALAVNANDRERRHLAAARAWLDGDFQQAVARYGDIAIEYPRDSLALQLAHLGDFYLGQSSQLRDRIARALCDWDESVPGYGYVLGMHAFGLEEMGDYGRAEERARRALELNPRDPWAVHAGAHVMEMQGRLGDGVHWLTSRTNDWAPDNGFAFHNWWHLALYHLDLGQHDRVLELYDTAHPSQALANCRWRCSTPPRCCGGCTCAASTSAIAGRSWRIAGRSGSKTPTTSSTTCTP